MRGRTTRLCVLVALAALAAVGVSASTAGAGHGWKNETPKLWFVEYPTAPLAEGSTDAAVGNDQKSFQSQAKAAGISYKERMRFTSLFNGVSVSATPSAVAKIEGLSSVKAVYPIATHRIPATEQISPDLATAITQTGADVAQHELGLTGKGVRVAVMDTGVDYDNPDLGGGFGKRFRVTKGWDFVGDAYNADPADPAYNAVTAPDPDPDDCNGHGTHVAGIIGAKGEVTGVAPGVTFGAYRVFGCEGSTTDDVMLAAMERVLKDHMDVLNMSIGDAFNNWPGAPTAAAASRLVKKGVVVVASIGNSGANGLYAAGAPGVGDNVIGVASFDNVQSTNFAFSLSPDGKLVGYDPATGAPTTPQSGSLAVTKTSTGTPTTTNDGCAASDFGPGVAGKAVLVRRGTCGFAVKAFNAQNAGAAAVILYNNAAGRVNPTVAAAPITIPVVAIPAVDGVTIYNRVVGGGTTLTWTSQTINETVATANTISSFSSYGLAADLTVKPDIGAPGGFIWSTYPLELGGHASLSGTSMASPHVAGAVALLLESLGEQRGRRGDDDDDNGWRSNRDDERNISRATLIRDILQNSADPKPTANPADGGALDGVQRQGAGMLDIVGAVEAKTLVWPGKLSLGEGNGATKRIWLVNNNRSTVTYTLSSAAALANGPNIFSPTQVDAPSTVTFSSPSVTLRRGEIRPVNVTITPNASLGNTSIYDGYIVVTPSVGDVLRVSYAGLKGDYQSIPLITVAFWGDVNWDEESTFTMQGISQPTVIWQAQLQSRRVQLLVIDSSDNVLGRAYDIEYFSRNSGPASAFELTWDGTYMPGLTGTPARVTAPNGTYKLMLTAEKPLAEPGNPAHTESFTTDAFTVARP